MPSDYQLSQDLGISIENGRYSTVDGEAFIRQHITLAILDVLAEAQYTRRTPELIEDVTTALRQRLTRHAQVETVERITIDRDAPPGVLRGEVVTDAVTIPLEEQL